MDRLKFKAFVFIAIIAAIGIEQADSFKDFIPFLISILLMVFLLIGSHFIDKILKK